MTSPAPLSADYIRATVRAALEEDLGLAGLDGARGDLTGCAIFPREARAHGVIRAREVCCLAGLEFAQQVFAALDADFTFRARAEDGEMLAPAQVVADLDGPARVLLAGERVALNFLMQLSGVATATHQLVQAVAGTGAEIRDTRKTVPGLRAAQKYAVRCGGGVNHRLGLYDAVMIKDNHLAACGGDIGAAVARCRAALPPGAALGATLEVEIDRVEQLAAALAAGPDIILLDNMTPQQVRACAQRVGNAARIEVSGGITAANARPYAEAGAHIISSGALTHSVRAIDFGLDSE